MAAVFAVQTHRLVVPNALSSDRLVFRCLAVFSSIPPLLRHPGQFSHCSRLAPVLRCAGIGGIRNDIVYFVLFKGIRSMKYMTILRAVAMNLACLGILMPGPLVLAAATPTVAEQLKVIDVGLHEGGVLFGQVVDAQGRPQSKLVVKLVQRDQVVAEATSDASGYFAVVNVPAGTYQIAADQTQGLYRLWAPKTAPPVAQPGALLVVGRGPIRAQAGPVGHWLSKPWVVAGLMAAAITIPVAIHNHQVDESVDP